MIRFNFHVSPKCSGCKYLKMDSNDWRRGGNDIVIKCSRLDKCNINEYREMDIMEVKDDSSRSD